MLNKPQIYNINLMCSHYLLKLLYIDKKDDFVYTKKVVSATVGSAELWKTFATGEGYDDYLI